MLTTSFGHSIRRNQHCINLRSHLGSAASCVLNQLQKYNIGEMGVSSRFHVFNPSFDFYKKHVNQTSTAINVEQTRRINRKVKHPSTNIKEGHSGEKTISVASLQACSEIHLFGQTGHLLLRGFT